MTNVNVWAAGSFYPCRGGRRSDEYDFWGFVVGGAWEPAPGLTMGPEFGYNSLDWTATVAFRTVRLRRLGCDVARSAQLLILVRT